MGISYWSLTGGGRLQEREWRIQGAPGLLLFLDQTEARGAEKTSFGHRPPPPHPLSQGVDDRPAPGSLSEGLDQPLNRMIRGVLREVRTHLFYEK